MTREELEDLIGESMEDMGLEEEVEERECSCGELIEDGNTSGKCYKCRQKG